MDDEFFDLKAGRRIPAQSGKRYPSEMKEISTKDCIFVGNKGVYDLASDQYLLTYNGLLHFQENGELLRVDYLNNKGGDRFENKYTYSYVALGKLPSIDYMIEWSKIQSCGELNQNDEFVLWREDRWETQRKTLDAIKPPSGNEVLFRKTLGDQLYWLRRKLGPYSSWDIGSKSNLPREDYERALRWIEMYPNKTEGASIFKIKALNLYRLSRYKESLATLQQEEEEQILPEQIGRLLLTSFTSSIAPIHSFGVNIITDNNRKTMQNNKFHSLRAMCHFKLSQNELAFKHLAEARKRVESEEGHFRFDSWYEIIYREAVELITGKPPSK
jgi:hypothetical protein